MVFRVVVVLISVFFFFIDDWEIVIFMMFVLRCLLVSLNEFCVWVDVLKNRLIWVWFFSICLCLLICWEILMVFLV